MTVVLSTVEEGLAFLVEYSHLEEVPDVVFDGELSQIRIDISGPRYHATIPGELARGLWQFQEAIYKAVADALHGREDIRQLAARRSDFELVFEVGDQSTDFIAKLKDFFAKLGEGFVTMDSKHKTVVLVAIAVLLAGGLGATSVVESQASVKKEEIKAGLAIGQEQEKTKQFEVLAEVARHHEAVAPFAKAAEEGARAIVRSVPDAKSVTLGRAKLNEGDIAEVNARAGKEKASAEIVTEEFRIIGVIAKDASSTKYILLRSKDAAEFAVTVNHDDYEAAVLDKIWAAARQRKPVTLEINLTLIRNTIRAAQIVKVV